MLTLEMPRRTKPLCRHCGPETFNPAVTPLGLCDTCERNYEIRELYVSESVKRSREPEGDFPATEADQLLARRAALEKRQADVNAAMDAARVVRRLTSLGAGKKIRGIRRASGMGLRAFARALGVSHGTILRWEADNPSAPVTKILVIAKRFRVPLKRFFE